MPYVEALKKYKGIYISERLNDILHSYYGIDIDGLLKDIPDSYLKGIKIHDYRGKLIKVIGGKNE